jgi:hypothetical protein
MIDHWRRREPAAMAPFWEQNMTWSSKSKEISVQKKNETPHQSNDPALIASPLKNKTVKFTPAEFFGAAARCCLLHLVDPTLVTAESAMIKDLVEPHVDDTNNDFAVEKTADNFKDYIKSYFVGTVAAGVAYLAATGDGTPGPIISNPFLAPAMPARPRSRISFLRSPANRMWPSSNRRARAAQPSVSTPWSGTDTTIRSSRISAIRSEHR